MRRVIIVTAEGVGEPYRLWDYAVKAGWQSGIWQQRIHFLKASVDDGEAIMVNEGQADPQIINTIIEFIEDYANQLQATDELLVAAHYHGTYQRIKQLAQRPQIHVRPLRHQKNDQPYEAIKAFVVNPTSETFEHMCREIKKKPNERLSILKHRLAHLFLPIDIDLQGLMETDFKQEYWDEVVEAWKGGKAVDMLEQAWELLYGQGESVEKVVEEAKAAATDDRKTKIENALVEVMKVLPKDSQTNRYLPDEYAEAEQILRCLGCRNMREYVRQKCRSKSNPFHDWFAKLDEALDKLREALQE